MEIKNTENSHSGKMQEFIKSKNFRTSLIAATIGSAAGFLYYYFGELKAGDELIVSSALMSAVWGGLLGLFIVNSPCSRGRC
jgi:membrane associated rhomboid family serine protease